MALRKQVYFKDSEMLELVEEFLSKQTNFSDSIMYLIEKEIAENGIRNLGEFIPQVRSKEYWSEISSNFPKNASSVPLNKSPEPVVTPSVATEPSQVSAEPSPSSNNLDNNVINPFRFIEDDIQKEDDSKEEVLIPSCYE